ncbi:hypothetical protein NHQ30_006459 [Ciborinia camelliae]|nr:hypothetical protein NHQ30_006459 [Ciborinia camelliae]
MIEVATKLPKENLRSGRLRLRHWQLHQAVPAFTAPVPAIDAKLPVTHFDSYPSPDRQPALTVTLSMDHFASHPLPEREPIPYSDFFLLLYPPPSLDPNLPVTHSDSYLGAYLESVLDTNFPVVYSDPRLSPERGPSQAIDTNLPTAHSDRRRSARGVQKFHIRLLRSIQAKRCREMVVQDHIGIEVIWR